ncbi:MAG: hypothetical protein IJN29_11425 [Akkermansia sp.]|nr:hypothetical protein [Akkermansia sp.]
MNTKHFTIATVLLGTMLMVPSARADWDNLWEDAQELGKKAQDIGTQAWEATKKQWDKLAENYKLLLAFGEDVSEESALIGSFYDLKHPIDGKASPLHRQQVVDLFHKFNNKKWDQDIFKAYYSPKVKLYAPYFYLPRCKAAYGPEAFQCNENLSQGTPKVDPTAWVVVYRGVVTAPQSGSFRFVGMGDDTLLVRFDNKLVLESGWSIPTRKYFDQGTHHSYQKEITQEAPSNNSRHQREITPKTKGRAIYQYDSTPHWNKNLGGIPSGVPFTVKKGEKYPIEILVSEIPGTEFGFCLLVEEIDDPKNPPYGIIDKSESPTLHLFRTSDSLPDPEKIRAALTANGKDYTINNGNEGPPFLKDSLIWKADFQAAQKRGLFSRVFGKITGSDKNTAMGTSHREDESEQDPPTKEQQNDAPLLDGWRLW